MASGAEFVALLEELSRELGAQAPTVDDFLLRRAGLLPGHGLGAPGWSGLAGQVCAALDAPPTGGATAAAGGLGQSAVDTPDALRALLEALAADFVRDSEGVAAAVAEHGRGWLDSGEWAHRTLPSVLDSWAAWLAAVLGRPRRSGLTPVEPVTWAGVAEQLLTARVYE
ncbi:hypothetical protein GCM10025734_80140 [Kitasatospora paranensis]